jgi:hypothetical protein
VARKVLRDFLRILIGADGRISAVVVPVEGAGLATGGTDSTVKKENVHVLVTEGILKQTTRPKIKKNSVVVVSFKF